MQGTTGPTGAPGLQGENGIVGAKGYQGTHGQFGKDVSKHQKRYSDHKNRAFPTISNALNSASTEDYTSFMEMISSLSF